jgi:hypothetical protein
MTKKLSIILFTAAFLLITFANLMSFSTGIGGRTRKQIGELEIGCSCHKILPVQSVGVLITGPSQVLPNSANIYKISLTGGPHIKGGFDFNTARGGVDTVGGQMTISFGLDITHSEPKLFGTQDTVSWLVKYIAPETLGYDTLFATGNSVNGNGIQDSLDEWNFSQDFIVQVVSSIGIKQNSNIIPKSFSLSQNYPNPFNPNTSIEFDIAKEGFTRLEVYDIAGNFTEELVKDNLKAGTYKINWNAVNLSSGVYFYRLTAEGYSETRKMILLK